MTPEIPCEALQSGALQAVTWQRALIALGVLIAFIGAAKVIGLLFRRALSRKADWGGPVFAVSKLLTYFLVFIGFVATLSYLGVPLSSLVLTSSAVLVGVGLSLQHVARDFVAGIILLVEQQIRKNDFVTFGNTNGIVQEIGLRSSHLITRDGMALVVPNHLLVTNDVVNHSHPLQRSRLDVFLPVAFNADINVVEETLLAVATTHPEVLSDPEPMVRLEAMTDLNFQFRLIAWVEDPVAQFRVASELRFAIARAFASRGIPFPTPELRLRGVGADALH